MRTNVSIAALVILLGMSPGVASAQADRHRRLISIDGGLQVADPTRTDHVAFELFAEDGQYVSTTDAGGGAFFGGGVGMRLWKRFGAGISVSHFSTTSTASLSASVPHPFFFGFPRRTTGTAGGLTQRQLAFHIQGQYWIPVKDWLLITSFGPTLFDVNQDVVSSIQTAERGFPFHEVDIVGHGVAQVSKSTIGYNLGLDATFFAFDRVGLAFLFRYSRATAGDIMIDGQGQPPIELGGLHVGGGIRFAF
jgi:hypothetical protein